MKKLYCEKCYEVYIAKQEKTSKDGFDSLIKPNENWFGVRDFKMICKKCKERE